MLRGLRDHVRLGARAHYELGDYGEALDALYGETTALALYHPNLQWEVLKGDFRGRSRSIRARAKDGGLVISAEQSGQLRDVIRLYGLGSEETKSLSERIGGVAWRPLGNGRISDQILMLQLPLHDEPASLRTFLMGKARLAVLRAMVYGCAPPARDIVPESGRCLTSPGTDRYDRVDAGQIIAVQVPSLGAIKEEAHSGGER
jgi:hypothetical protein